MRHWSGALPAGRLICSLRSDNHGVWPDEVLHASAREARSAHPTDAIGGSEVETFACLYQHVIGGGGVVALASAFLG